MRQMKYLTMVLLLGVSWQLSARDTLRLTLEEAVQVALTENPVVRIAGKEVERQYYFLKEAKGNLIPTLNASGSFSRNLKDSPMFMSGSMIEIFMGDQYPGEIPDVIARRMAGTTNSYSASVQLRAPLFSMGLYKSIALSEVGVQMALEAARKSRLSLKNEVEKAFFGLMMAQNALEVMQKSLANAERNLSDARARYDQGMAAEYDLIRSEVQVSNIRPSVLQAQDNVSLAGWQLRLLLGLDLQTPLQVLGDLSDYEPQMLQYRQFPVDLSGNAELSQLGMQARQLHAQLDLLKTNKMPSLYATGTYAMVSQNSDFKVQHYQWLDAPSVGLSLSVPIFNGWTNQHKERQVKLAMDQLSLQKEYREQSLSLEARQAHIRMQQAVDQLQSNKDGMRQAGKAYDIAQTRYHNGIGTMLELNDADVALTQSKLNYHQSIFEFLKARSDFDLLTGKEQ